MANVWVREFRGWGLTPTTGLQWPSGTFAVALAFFLERVLGYTFDTESVAASFSFRTAWSTGTDGELTATDKTFKATGIGDNLDAQRFLVIVSTTGWNGGIYKFVSRTSADEVVIDTRTGVAEFPTAQTGLTYYVVRTEADRPYTDGDYIRLISPAGWAIELKLDYSSNYKVCGVRISPNNTWTGVNAKIIGPVWFGQGGSNYYEQTTTNWYLYFLGNTEGTLLHMWLENANGGNWIVSIGSIVPVETVHPADELMLLTGPTMSLGSYNDNSKAAAWATRDTGIYGCFGNGFVWTDAKRIARQVWAMENGYGALNTGFSKKGGEINQRTGKNDLMIGTLYMLDAANAYEEYEYLGFVNHHLSGRSNLARRSAMDVDGNKDKYHISDGIIVEWPSVTPQF